MFVFFYFAENLILLPVVGEWWAMNMNQWTNLKKITFGVSLLLTLQKTNTL